MSQLTVEQLTHDALTLPENERTRLAHALLQSLEASTETGVEDAWDAEVSRRVEAVRQGTAQGRSADDVFQDARNRYEK